MSETHVERVHTEHVVLDIGGDIGALIIYTPDHWRGREIELSPICHDGKRVHNQVHERNVNGHSCFAAVYPDLRAGVYDVLDEAGVPKVCVTIQGGEVASLDWSRP